MTNPPLLDRRVGLCSICQHGARVTSARGTSFWMCELSKTEPAKFRKYPPLPVRTCTGFKPQPGAGPE